MRSQWMVQERKLKITSSPPGTDKRVLLDPCLRALQKTKFVNTLFFTHS